ncbi:phage tail tape measure protein [Bacillus sp. ISL-18]|uniref:phage tail tape measure protein n=1 Tax=Bacillus sp. ISL-18 TaxID=2819118 RepID=UPI001BEC2A0B|nr:phage tail tape measure protein [Bacillus sp. ISL-18]MBT2653920.1 phage tail tape measure protein [Bacillus sp. ISL-18]
METTGRSARNIGKDVDKLSKVFMGVGGAVALGMGAAVKTGADFEAQMSRVKAISGASAEEFDALKKSAMDLGASTSKSASEVAVGFENMAAMGMNANDIIAAMPGVISAAEASGSDMAQTADVMASSLNIFGLKASEASRVADILAQVSNQSAANLTDMQYALKYAGPPAAALGVSLEELSASIGIMTNAGMAGEMAGTSLRGALLSLLNPSEENSKLMGKMGIAVADAKGNFVGLSKLVQNLSDSMEGQTETQKAATLAALVGTESVSGMLSLMKAGPATIDKMTDSLKNSAGASKTAAAIMKDNLNGSIDNLKGSLETIGIELSEDILPLLSDLAKEIANVLSSMDDVDMANLKSGLGFAGVASAVGLTGTSLVKLGIAARGLFLAMGGPVTLTIGALALLGGSIAAAVIKNKEMEKARLDNIQAGFKEVDALDKSVQAFDRLQSKSKLTTEEFGRYLDIQAEIKRTSDPDTIARLKDEMQRLQERSGLSNKELGDMVGLNKELTDKVPEASRKISEQGNAILENTKAIKARNAAEREALYDKLNLERLAKETEYKDLLEKEKTLIKERNDEEKKLQGLVAEKTAKQREENDAQKELNKRKQEGSGFTEAEIQQQQVKVKLAKDDVSLAQDRITKQAELVQSTDKELSSTQKKLGKLEETRIKMQQLVLQQVGLNSEKGQELAAIDKAIGKLQAQKAELQKNTTPAQRMTAEYKESVSALDTQIGRLQTAKTKVEEITGKATAMNAELSRGVTKTVTIQTRGDTGGTWMRNKIDPDAQRHTGGTLPKFHVGGSPAFLQNLPNHNEIDVRLLRNEMVLTEAQQSNLFRMIDAGTGNSGNTVTFTDPALVAAIKELASRSVIVEMDGEKIARAAYPHIDSKMADETKRANRMLGFKR